MPEPGKNESHKDFIDRCIPIVIEEGTAKDGKQGRAICESIWRKNKGNNMTTLRLIGIIGDDTQGFLSGLPENNEDVIIEMNSPGGDIFDGFTIYNKLKDYQGKVTIDVLGQAASAASLIAMAGDEILIRKNARMMIHNPFTGRMGDVNDFKKTAGELEKITKDLAGIYSERTGIDVDDILQMMNDETWLSAKDAVKKGFATKVLDSVKKKIRNFIDELKGFGYKNIPEEYLISEFSTDPFAVESFSDLPVDTSNVNAMRFTLAFIDDENLQNKYNKFKQQNPKYNKKIELQFGKHVYPLTDMEVRMIQQLLEKLEVENPEDALAKIDELKKPKVEKKIEYKSDPEVQNLINAQNEKINEFKVELEKKDSTIELLTTQIKEATDFVKNQKTEKRKAILNGLLEEGFINGAQLEAAEANYLSMPDESFEATVEFIKAGGAAHKSLQNLNGSDDEGKAEVQYKTASDEVNAEIVKYQKENKELSYSQAYAMLEAENPELIKKYTEEVEKQHSA